MNIRKHALLLQQQARQNNAEYCFKGLKEFKALAQFLKKDEYLLDAIGAQNDNLQVVLVLTNLRLILINYSIFGNPKCQALNFEHLTQINYSTGIAYVQIILYKEITPLTFNLVEKTAGAKFITALMHQISNNESRRILTYNQDFQANNQLVINELDRLSRLHDHGIINRIDYE